ncbi:MAG TPA: acyltransferase family protein [Gemmatimonadaceae bacterium]
MTERPGFRPDIEGLRGAAILLVVAFHAAVPGLVGGYVGVDVFFVLSGFFITGLLAREITTTGSLDLTEFYARRARRLLPAFLVVLFATIVIALLFYAPIDRPKIAFDARAVALHYGNVLFARDAVNYHASSQNPFLHTWSLAVEEQFYVIWPLLFLFVGRFYAGKESINKQLMTAVVIAGAASFALSLWITQVAQPWAFFGMPTRIWEFALGGIVALQIARGSETTAEKSERAMLLQIGGLVAIATAAAIYHDATPYPGAAALLPALGTVALIVGGHRAPDSRVSRILGSPVLRWFGRVSYAWYLWHWPLVGLGAVLDWQIGFVGRLAWSAFALVLAMLTLRFVEEPARDPERLRLDSRLLAGGAVAVSVAAALVATGALAIAHKQATSRVQRPFAMARKDGMRHDCWGSLLENASAPCEFGDRSSRTTVVLMGDSHAEHWLPAVDRIGRERGWRVIAMVKPACPVADVPTLVNARLKRYYSECNEWRRAKLRRIVAMRPSLVILSSFDYYVAGDGASDWRVSPASWRDGLRKTYGILSRAGIRTVAIRDVPNVGFDVPGCLSRNAGGVLLDGRACEYDLTHSLSRPAWNAQTDAARGLPYVALVDMTDRFCDSGRCSVVKRGAVVYRDDDHLTATFSRNEAPELGRRVIQAVATLPRR